MRFIFCAKEVMFLHLRVLSLSVDRIAQKVVYEFDEIFEGLGCATSSNWSDFDVDPDHDIDTGIFKYKFYHWRILARRVQFSLHCCYCFLTQYCTVFFFWSTFSLNECRNWLRPIGAGLATDKSWKSKIIGRVWLPIHWRIQYKLSVLMHGIITGKCPDYLRTIVQPVTS